jgi:hypothetical protein
MQNYEFFGKEENYYVRIYDENGKIRLQGLKMPPLLSEKYDSRVFICYTDKGIRRIEFYLDGLWLGHEEMQHIMRKIYTGLGWRFTI